MMEHIEKMARQIAFAGRLRHDVSEDAAEFWQYTEGLGRDVATKQAQAAFDALIKAVPDLVWVQVDDYCSIAKTKLGNYGIQVVDAEDTQCFDLWLAGEDLDDFADHTFGTEAAAKAHANLTRRAKIRAIWETKE